MQFSIIQQIAAYAVGAESERARADLQRGGERMTEDLEGLYAVAQAFIRTYDDAAERKRRASLSRRAAKWGIVRVSAASRRAQR